MRYLKTHAGIGRSRLEGCAGRDAAIWGRNVGRGFSEAAVTPAFQATLIDQPPAAASHGLGIDSIGKAYARTDIAPIGEIGIAGVAADAGKLLTSQYLCRDRNARCLPPGNIAGIADIRLKVRIGRNGIHAGQAHALVKSVVPVPRTALHIVADAQVQCQFRVYAPIILKINGIGRITFRVSTVPADAAAAWIPQIKGSQGRTVPFITVASISSRSRSATKASAVGRIVLGECSVVREVTVGVAGKNLYT